MTRLLTSSHALSDRFTAYTLARNIRLAEDLVDRQLSRLYCPAQAARPPIDIVEPGERE